MSGLNFVKPILLAVFAFFVCTKSQIGDISVASSRHFLVELFTFSYSGSNEHCTEYGGGNLTSVMSQSEQDEINELIASASSITGNVYIGYNKIGSTSFSWEDSSTSTYTNWCTNEPSTTTGFDCAAITSSGCWVATQCTNSHYPLCRRADLLYSSNSNYVIIESTGAPYEDAETICKNTVGASLATITTAAEQTEIYALIQSHAVNFDFYSDYYIGLNDRIDGSTLEWIDGTTVDTTFINTNLNPTQFNDDNCVYISETDGEWYYEDCDFGSYFVCNAPVEEETTNFIRVDARFSFLNANEYCKDEFSTTLATISSATQNSEAAAVASISHWIGYNDKASEGNFVWLSGTSTYTNWRTSTNEPNNGGTGEDCVLMTKFTAACSGCWNDVSCSVPRRPFFCNKPSA